MKRMKRILCLTLVLALSVALCACGKKDTAKNKGGNTEAPTTTTTVDDWAGNLGIVHRLYARHCHRVADADNALRE